MAKQAGLPGARGRPQDERAAAGGEGQALRGRCAGGMPLVVYRHVHMRHAAFAADHGRASCHVLLCTLKLCCMLLLLQVADGSYAFVLHTANPLTGQLGEMFGELVPGLGEVLVSCIDDPCYTCAQCQVDGQRDMLSFVSPRPTQHTTGC